MDSDSESQDSDEGRRFRFEATRKDAILAPLFKTKVLLQSPQRNKHLERRSHSKNTSSRYERSRHSKDDFLRKSQSSSDKNLNNKYVIKERSSKDTKNNSKDSNSRRQYKNSRTYRTKDFRNYDLKESRDSKVHINNKHKNKLQEKHKKDSRDKSREKNNQVNIIEETPKKEKKKITFDIASIPKEMEQLNFEKKKVMKKQHSEDKKVNYSNVDKMIKSDISNSMIVSDIMVSLTSTVANTATGSKKLKSFFDRVVNKRIQDDNNSLYGPVLSSKLEKKILNAKDVEIKIEKSTKKIESPLKSVTYDNQQILGLSLPEYLRSPLQKNNIITNKEQSDKKVEKKQVRKKKREEIFGPALPPHMEKIKIVGPMLPKNFIISKDKMHTDKIDSEFYDEEDKDVVGPLPIDHPAVRESYVQIQLDHREGQVKTKFTNKTSPKINKREEWMVELPPAHPVTLNLCSMPRKFKSIEGPNLSDRSVWTDTPLNKLHKQLDKEENQFIQSEDLDKKFKKCKYQDTTVGKETVAVVQCESLLKMHLKTLKKKKKKLEKQTTELGISYRRPFNRDIDLHINQLDDVRKTKFLEKSNLNDRFTSGKI